MWRRLAKRRVEELARRFPAVMIVGARQVGKTTLARQVFARHAYVDLEDPQTQQTFSEDPRFQLDERAQRGVIIDEAQQLPPLFPALRGAIDADRKRNGRFVLLGSAQPTLIRQASESLAGRVGIVELEPLTAVEVRGGTPRVGWKRLWLTGGFPDAAGGDFREWWEAFLRTYVERDLPALGLTVDPLLLRRLITMLAHQQGGLFNASALGAALGISYHTVQRYVDLLEQTFLVRRLPPYFRNVGKRLTKSPKLYIRDTGLLHHVLGIGSHADLDAHPIRGASWETFVIEDLVRREHLAHPHAAAYFWRTATGDEIDLVVERSASGRLAFEIKAGSGRDAEAARKLARSLVDVDAKRGWIVGQLRGTEPLGPSVERRGFDACIDWLPP